MLNNHKEKNNYAESYLEIKRKSYSEINGILFRNKSYSEIKRNEQYIGNKMNGLKIIMLIKRSQTKKGVHTT